MSFIGDLRDRSSLDRRVVPGSLVKVSVDGDEFWALINDGTIDDSVIELVEKDADLAKAILNLAPGQESEMRKGVIVKVLKLI